MPDSSFAENERGETESTHLEKMWETILADPSHLDHVEHLVSLYRASIKGDEAVIHLRAIMFVYLFYRIPCKMFTIAELTSNALSFLRGIPDSDGNAQEEPNDNEKERDDVLMNECIEWFKAHDGITLLMSARLYQSNKPVHYFRANPTYYLENTKWITTVIAQARVSASDDVPDLWGEPNPTTPLPSQSMEPDTAPQMEYTATPSVNSQPGLSQEENDLIAPNRPPTPDNQTGARSRGARKTAQLCHEIKCQLQAGAKTRDELAVMTGFARQRVCTIVTVYRAIGLIVPAEQKSKLEWETRGHRRLCWPFHMLMDVEHDRQRVKRGLADINLKAHALFVKTMLQRPIGMPPPPETVRDAVLGPDPDFRAMELMTNPSLEYTGG